MAIGAKGLALTVEGCIEKLAKATRSQVNEPEDESGDERTYADGHPE